MKVDQSVESSAASTPLAALNGQLEQRLWAGVMTLLGITTPLSVMRALDTGWLAIYTFQSVLFAVLAVFFFGRRLAPSKVRVLVALAYLEIAGVQSLFLMGFLGFGSLWLVAFSYLVAVMFGHRAGMVCVAVNAVIMIIAAYCYHHGLLSLTVNGGLFMKSPTTWVLAVTMCALFSAMLINSVGLFKSATEDLVQDLERQRREIEILATHDQLSGLVQMRVAHDRLNQALHRAHRSGHMVAVLFLDLDGFKQVNDQHGHAAGDHVLRTVADLVKSVVRESDTVSRIGGDEFLVILDDIADREIAARVSRRILQDLRRPIPYQNALLQVQACIGIALYPHHGTDTASLQRAADAAMYLVKNDGKAGYAFSGEEKVLRPTEVLEPGRTGSVRHLVFGQLGA